MKKILAVTTIALTAIGVAVRANVKSNYQKSITIDGTTGKTLW